MSAVFSTIVHLYKICLVIFTTCFVVCASLYEIHIGADERIREGSWILVSMVVNGRSASQDEISKKQQILFIKDNIYVLLMNGERDQIGKIEYPRNTDKNIKGVDFFEMSPHNGGIVSYEAIFRMEIEEVQGAKLKKLVICKQTIPNERNRPTEFTSSIKGCVLEEYRHGKF